MTMPSLLGLMLKYQGYPPAVLVAVSLHGALLYFLLGKSLEPEQYVDVDRPVYLNASVIQQNPQRLRRLEQLELQRAAQEQAEDKARQEAARQRAEEEARQRAEREAQARLEASIQAEQERQLAAQRAREQEEAERRAREEAQRREREAAEQRERERQQQQLALDRAREEAEAARLELEEDQVQAYAAVIHDTVTRNWSIPPSARNGMKARLRIHMVPTGEVVDVSILESSGDAAFDRSAEQAVHRAGRFPELQGMPIALFEKEFRTFYLLFQPEDLLR